MARVIPNEECWIGFLPDAEPVDLCSPTAAEIAECIDLTCFVSSLNASSQGNTVPVPELCSLYEKSIQGTVSASFSGEFYRDDEKTPEGVNIDLAWNTLPMKTKGTFIIARFGVEKNSPPKSGDAVECWPVLVSARTAGPMSSGTPLTFTLTAAVPEAPCEDGVVAA